MYYFDIKNLFLLMLILFYIDNILCFSLYFNDDSLIMFLIFFKNVMYIFINNVSISVFFLIYSDYRCDNWLFLII